MNGMTSELEVFLNETPVAQLVRGDDGQVRLRFLGSYVQMTGRPMLGLHYLGKLRAPLDPEPQVPAFFTNLLPDPDGPLRTLVVAAAGVRDDKAFASVTLESFARLASALQETPEVVKQWAAEDVQRIMDAWSSVGGLEHDVRFALDQHHASLRRAGLLHR